MKKAFFTLLAVSAGFVSSAFGQTFEKGSKVASLGYGFPNLGKLTLSLIEDESDFQATGLGPIHFRYESGISNDWSIGLSANFTRYGAKWKDSGFDARIDVSTYSLLLRINNYFLNEETVQVYGGFGAGYRGRFGSYKNDRPGATDDDGEFNSLISKVTIPIGFEATLGVRTRFTPGFGGYVELGLAKSVVQGGIYFRF
jgi:hypothetical protein